jgi:hypothetical protein
MGQQPPWGVGGLFGGGEGGGGPAILGKEKAGNAEITPVQVRTRGDARCCVSACVCCWRWVLHLQLVPVT